jgi:hypothetical protein
MSLEMTAVGSLDRRPKFQMTMTARWPDYGKAREKESKPTQVGGSDVSENQAA